jgi:hypothetical protein
LRGAVAHPVVSTLALMIMIALLFCFVPVRILDDEATSQGRLLRLSSSTNVYADVGSMRHRRQRGGILGSFMRLKDLPKADVDQDSRRPALPFPALTREDGGSALPAKELPANGETSEEVVADLDDLSSVENSNAESGADSTAQGGDVLDGQVFGRDLEPAADPEARRKSRDVYIRLRRIAPAHPVSELKARRS